MRKLFTIVLLWFSPYLFAQLNGTYTIGASGSDYTTVQLAVAALTTNGVSGPVVFQIKPGTYNVYNLLFEAVPGASSVNSITFQSEDLNPESVIFTGCMMRANSNSMIFNKLTFDVYQTTNLSNANAFKISGDNCAITNCVFTHNYLPVTEAMYNNINSKEALTFIVIMGSDITIANNTFNGKVGCCILKNSYSATENNLTIFDNIFNGENVHAIELGFLNTFTISHNTFSSATIKSSILTTDIIGNALIEKNIINNNYNSVQSTSYSALSLTAMSPSSSTISNLILRNNFVNSKSQNLRITNFRSCKVLNNNFKSSYNCIYIEPNYYTTAFIVKNNVFYSTGLKAMEFAQTFNQALVVSDYNAFSINNDTPIYRNLNYYTLSSWQSATGKEVNSKISDMVYASDTDLHTPNAVILSGSGTALSDVSNDIDNELRIAIPDIGADEFNMDLSSFRDLELVSIDSPSLIDCANTAILLSIKNNGSSVVNSFDIQAKFSIYPSVLNSYTTTINPGQVVQVPFANLTLIPNNLYEKISFIVSNPNNLLDNDFSNNTKFLSNYATLGDFPIVVEKDNCGAYKSLTIALTENSILWSNGGTSNKINISQPGVYSVTVTNALGCSYTKSITLN